MQWLTDQVSLAQVDLAVSCMPHDAHEHPDRQYHNVNTTKNSFRYVALISNLLTRAMSVLAVSCDLNLAYSSAMHCEASKVRTGLIDFASVIYFFINFELIILSLQHEIISLKKIVVLIYLFIMQMTYRLDLKLP